MGAKYNDTKYREMYMIYNSADLSCEKAPAPEQQIPTPTTVWVKPFFESFPLNGALGDPTTSDDGLGDGLIS